jgi:cobalt-zinc-cadmium efflux system outer membrane protein
MTLERVIETVRVFNPELAALRARIAVLDAAAIKSSAYPNPSIEVEQSQPDAGLSREFKVTQPIPLTNRRSLSRTAARAEADAFRREVSAMEAALSASAKQAYFTFRLAETRARFEESNRTFALNVLNKVQARVLVGDARTVDAARAKVELEEARFNLEAAKSRMLLAAAAMNRAMGRRPDEPLSFPSDDPDVLRPPETDGSFDQVLTEALAGRGDVQAAALRKEAAELSLRLERNKRWPDLRAGFARGRESGAGFNKFILGVELPVWYRNKGEVAAARADLAAREEDRRSRGHSASFEVYGAWLGRHLARTRVSAMRRNVQSVDELREVNSRDYLSGKIDLSAYYEGNRVFLEQNVSFLDALQEYHDRDVELEQALSASLRP